MTFKPWDTFETKCGNGRITYHPEWSASLPWASYWHGAAGRHFQNVLEAANYFRRNRGATLDTSALRRDEDALAGVLPNN